MKRNIFLQTIVLALFLLQATVAFSAQDVRIAATIADVHQLNVVLNKVEGGIWTPITDLTGSGMEFGQLIRDPDNIYRSPMYFVIDAPVTSNHTTWTLTHTRTNIANTTAGRTTFNLNLNVNVTFVKVDNTTEAESPFTGILTNGGYMSYEASNNVQLSKTQLTDSRLRIYYGIAGGTGGDAPNVVPITTDNRPSGTYLGKITLTLSA